MGAVAWGDESEPHVAEDPGAYVLGAALADSAVADRLRSAMADFRLGSSGPKLHWKDESHKRRLQLAEAITSLPVEGFVVVRRGLEAERPERRRRKCLEQLLWALGARGCERLILEARGPVDDRKDRDLVDSLRRAQRLSSGLRLSHTAGPGDAVLWLADALCGAVTQDLKGRPEYLEMIQSSVTVEITWV